MTHGAQQAIGLAGALLVERGETVVVEDPTYLGSIDIFSGQKARLVTVPVGGDAAWLARLRETVARTSPRLVYLMPTFQNPTGVVMPETCRRALAKMSRELRLPIVEAPTGFAVYPKDVVFAPRALAEQATKLVRWTVMPRGGHFGPAEQPQAAVEDLTTFFHALRDGA